MHAEIDAVNRRQLAESTGDALGLDNQLVVHPLSRLTLIARTFGQRQFDLSRQSGA